MSRNKTKTFLKLLTFLFLILKINVTELFAQDESKTVVITATGSGRTVEESRQSALRSATEQAFGAFVSSKTELFNDKVLADEISSLSSGNIKSYEILNETDLGTLGWSSTVKAVLSVEKLSSFASAKGMDVQISGSLFAANIKQQILNESAEERAVLNTISILNEIMHMAFDYSIESGMPVSSGGGNDKWNIPLSITAVANQNCSKASSYLISTLMSISLKQEELATYQDLKKPVYSLSIDQNGKTVDIYLRNNSSYWMIYSILSSWFYYASNFEYGIKGVLEPFSLPNYNWENTISFSSQDDFIEKEDTRNNNSQKFNRMFIFKNLQCSSCRYDEGGQIFELSNPTYKFPKDGDVAAKFCTYLTATLQELEKISGFTTRPRGLNHAIKYGGFLVTDTSSGTNLVISPFDLDGNKNYREIGSLSILGFSDWTLPTRKELGFIRAKMGRLGFWSRNYYSADESNYDNYYEWNARPIRRLFINKEAELNYKLLKEKESELMELKVWNKIADLSELEKAVLYPITKVGGKYFLSLNINNKSTIDAEVCDSCTDNTISKTIVEGLINQKILSKKDIYNNVKVSIRGQIVAGDFVKIETLSYSDIFTDKDVMIRISDKSRINPLGAGTDLIKYYNHYNIMVISSKETYEGYKKYFMGKENIERLRALTD